MTRTPGAGRRVRLLQDSLLVKPYYCQILILVLTLTLTLALGLTLTLALA